MNNTTPSRPSATGESLPAHPQGSASQSSPEPGRAKTADAISDLGSAAKEAADTLVFATTQNLKDVANQQVAAGADLVRQFGSSVRAAGAELERSAPQLARMVLAGAEKIERSADQLRGQSIDQLASSTAEFARERPEIVFGVAAVCGFFLFRILNAGMANVPPSFRPGSARLRSTHDPSRSGQQSPSLARS